MSRTTEKVKYHYLNVGTGDTISVDTIFDGKILHIIPERNGLILFDFVKKVAVSRDETPESVIRAHTAHLLNDFEQIGSEDDTIEIDRYVFDSMGKTPISFADGVYGKEFVPALILCLDLRRFSDFARDNPREKVKNFLEKYTQELLATINIFSVSYYKLLGDGALIIWDNPTRKELNEALQLFDLLTSVLHGIGQNFDFPNNLAGGIVQDEVYKYEIYAECSGLKYRDYIGYGINYVFRLQTFAESCELLSNRSIPDQYGLVLPELDSRKKPDKKTLKGVRDEDYSDIYVLRAAVDKIR